MRTLMAAAVMALAMGAAQAQPISIEAYEHLRGLEGGHCSIGQPEPRGDWSVREWRRQRRLCPEIQAKLNKLMQRCKAGVGENSEVCAQMMQWHTVRRYPPPDPRKRE